MKRYLLKRDEDSHWYLIELGRETEFETKCAEAYKSDDFSEFEDAFGEDRINGPHDLSFCDPRDSHGDRLR